MGVGPNRRRVLGGSLIALLVVAAAACTPSSTDPAPDPAPAMVSVSYLTQGSILTYSATLTFTLPAEFASSSVTDVLVDVSCDGGATIRVAGLDLPQSTPATQVTVGHYCVDGAASSYRVAAVLNGSAHSAYSAWMTGLVTPFAAPVLTSVDYGQYGPRLEFGSPALAANQFVTDYPYQASCDGGQTVVASALLYLFLRVGTVPSFCPAGTVNSYRLAAIVNNTWTTPYSPWVTMGLTAPALTGGTRVSGGVSLSFSPVGGVCCNVAAGPYFFDLSCDGGATVLASDLPVTLDFSTGYAGTAPRTCGSKPSTYRIYGVVSGIGSSPRSGWLTVT